MDGLRVTGLLALLYAGSPVWGQEPAGVVVVEAAPGGAAARAGLRAGDRLLGWEQADVRGVFASPFDVAGLELERGPRGPVQVAAVRAGVPLTALLSPDDWGLQTRPALPEETVAAYDAARRLIDDGKAEAGRAALQALAEGLQGTPDPSAWAWLELARAEARGRRTDAAEAAIRKALAVAPGTAPARDALLWAALGQTLEQGQRPEPALAAYREARAIRVRIDPDSVATATAAAPPALLARAQGSRLAEARTDVEAAVARLEQAAPRSLARARVLQAWGWLQEARPASREAFSLSLALAEDLAPDGLLVAKGLHGLAYVTDEPERQIELRRRAVAIHERLDPESPDMVAAYSVLGGTLRENGDNAGAEAWNRRALALVERLAPDTQWQAMTLYNTALLHQARGDMAEAEALLRRTLAIVERIMPPGERHGLVQYAIGLLLAERGEHDEAERFLRRSLQNLEAVGRGATLRGYCLKTLGTVERNRGRPEAAEPLLKEALEVFRSVSMPLEIGAVQRWIGNVLTDRGRLSDAAAAYEEGLKALEGRYSRSVTLADLHRCVGDLEVRRGDLEAAERHHGAALQLLGEIAPGSLMEALAAHGMGTVARRRGHRDEALAFYRRAVEALETQSLNLGGSAETRAGYRANFHRFYGDLEELLLETGRPEAAFEVHERSRARELLRLLAGRDLEMRGDLPEDLAQERRRADAEHDRVVKALSETGLDDGRRAATLRQLEEARRRQADVRARIRGAAPRLAALSDPQPLDLAGVRQALDPGTLLLSIGLGTERSRIYAVGPDPGEFAVLSVDAGQKQLRADVARFRELIETRQGRMLRRALDEDSARLGRLLLGPAAAQLARARRVLIVPDGVLHLLPFAALIDPSVPGARRYVIEGRPLHVVSSVTLYAQVTRLRAAPAAALKVVGFGDPAYPGGAAAPQGRPALRRAMGAGLRLEPLPATRLELAALKAHFPRSAEVFLGAQATEERAKSVDRTVGIVHFATHGFVDEAFPLESGLALTMPSGSPEGRDNGLLQAWEIFESVRLDADLVTLSACQTGLGKEFAGEGLLGLTWAFQYAGARSVLASLWEWVDPRCWARPGWSSRPRAICRRGRCTGASSRSCLRSRG